MFGGDIGVYRGEHLRVVSGLGLFGIRASGLDLRVYENPGSNE